MSNQHKSALAYAAEELKDLLERYQITVDVPERMITFGEIVKPVPFGTTRRECLAMLHKLISEAMRLERERQQKRQGVLL